MKKSKSSIIHEASEELGLGLACLEEALGILYLGIPNKRAVEVTKIAIMAVEEALRELRKP